MQINRQNISISQQPYYSVSIISMRLEVSMSHHSLVSQSTRRTTFLVIAGIISFAFLFPSCTPTPQTMDGEVRFSAGTSPVTLKPVGSMISAISVDFWGLARPKG